MVVALLVFAAADVAVLSLVKFVEFAVAEAFVVFLVVFLGKVLDSAITSLLTAGIPHCLFVFDELFPANAGDCTSIG